MKRATIITIIPAAGWAWEDRSGAAFARHNARTAYSYQHDLLVCFALCEFEDDDGKTWREVRGVTRWAEEPEGMTPLDDVVPTMHLECDGQCDETDQLHWESLPKKAG